MKKRKTLLVYKVHKVRKVHKVSGSLRGALPTAAGAADKLCPKDTCDLMDLTDWKMLNLRFF